MHGATALALVTLATLAPGRGAPAQAPAAGALRLVDRVEAPIAYVQIDGSESATAGAPGPVCRLLADPGLDAFVVRHGGPTARAWSLVRGVLTRRCEQFELALTSVVPGSGTPLLLLRVQLPETEAVRLRELLDAGSLAEPHRRVGSRQTFRLTDRPAAGPGELVELALVGSDLLVGNDGLGMQELLGEASRETSAAPRRVLSADPGFVAMRERLPVPPGSLVAYGDWQRVGGRLQESLAGLPGLLVDLSGLGGARRAMVTLAPDGAAFAATLLLSFEGLDGAADPDVPSVDGWLAAAQRVTAKQLVPELPGSGFLPGSGSLPGGGFGGVVLAVDLAALAASTHRGEHVLHDLRHSFADYGLDFDRNVLGRLGTLGTVQLLLRDVPKDDVPGAAAEVVAVYAVRARTKAAAADLFTDLRRAAEAHGVGRLVAAKERRAPDVLELRPRREPDAASPPICVAVVEDTVLVAFDVETIQRVHEDYRRSARNRGRRDAVVTGVVQRIGAVPVSGLFDVDLRGLFDRLLRPNDGGGSRDLSGVPARHVGYLALEPHDDGSFVRIRVMSSL